MSGRRPASPPPPSQLLPPPCLLRFPSRCRPLASSSSVCWYGLSSLSAGEGRSLPPHPCRRCRQAKVEVCHHIHMPARCQRPRLFLLICLSRPDEEHEGRPTTVLSVSLAPAQISIFSMKIQKHHARACSLLETSMLEYKFVATSLRSTRSRSHSSDSSTTKFFNLAFVCWFVRC
jgi:hypothetical protein